MNSACVIAAGVLFGLGALTAHKITSDRYRADMLTAERRAHAAYVARTKELDEVARALEVAKNEKKLVYRTITKRVETYIDRPVYRNICLDDYGLRDVNAAIAGRADPGQPSATLSAADAAGGQDRRGRTEEAD